MPDTEVLRFAVAGGEIPIVTDIPTTTAQGESLWEDVPRWASFLRQTARSVPDAALRLLVGGQVVIALGNPANGGGTRTRVGTRMQEIRISYRAFNTATSPWNQIKCYTFLHEIGHLVNDWRQNVTGVASSRQNPSCIGQLRRLLPLCCWAIMRRPHNYRPAGTEPAAGRPAGGGTEFPAEHFADVFADYCHTRLGSPQPESGILRMSMDCTNWHQTRAGSAPGPMVQNCLPWFAELRQRIPPETLAAVQGDIDAQIRERYVGLFYELLALGGHWTGEARNDAALDAARDGAVRSMLNEVEPSAAGERSITRGPSRVPAERPRRGARPEGSSSVRSE